MTSPKENQETRQSKTDKQFSPPFWYAPPESQALHATFPIPGSHCLGFFVAFIPTLYLCDDAADTRGGMLKGELMDRRLLGLGLGSLSNSWYQQSRNDAKTEI